MSLADWRNHGAEGDHLAAILDLGQRRDHPRLVHVVGAVVVVALAFGAAIAPVDAVERTQAPTSAADRLRFDVASVKTNVSGDPRVIMSISPGVGLPREMSRYVCSSGAPINSRSFNLTVARNGSTTLASTSSLKEQPARRQNRFGRCCSRSWRTGSSSFFTVRRVNNRCTPSFCRGAIVPRDQV